jgi:hypothetical protein
LALTVFAIITIIPTPMKIRRPIVLGIVRSYKVDALAPFVLSLRRSGYTGDIGFFVDDLPQETLEFFYQQGVTMQPLPTRYFIQSRRHLIRAVANMAPAKYRQRAQIELSRYYLHLIDARWPCYYEFLQRTRGLYSHIMFSDIKDVVFQRNPFDFDWRAPICSFLTPPDVTIRDEEKTFGWITTGFGVNVARQMQDKRTIGCGVTFAEFDAAIEYVRLMCEHFIRINARGLVDQGVHNYLLYNDLRKSTYIYEYDETPVLHLGLMPKDMLRVNDEGLVLNGSGSVVNVVHQYAEHRAAMQRSLELATKL